MSTNDLRELLVAVSKVNSFREFNDLLPKIRSALEGTAAVEERPQRTLASLVLELAEAVDNAHDDIGGSRPQLTILREAVVEARRAQRQVEASCPMAYRIYDLEAAAKLYGSMLLPSAQAALDLEQARRRLHESVVAAVGQQVAAAPELLAGAKQLMKSAPAHMTYRNHGERLAYEALRAAIAKATGAAL